MTAKSSSQLPVEAVPPLSPKWGWRVLLAGLAVSGVAAVLGFAIDLAAVSGQPQEMAERMKWASGQGGANSFRSEGELRRLRYEIGKTTPLSTGRVGLVAGIFFGFAFGLGGLGAAGMGRLADATSIEFVYQVSAYLPLIGLLIALLPRLDRGAGGRAA